VGTRPLAEALICATETQYVIGLSEEKSLREKYLGGANTKSNTGGGPVR